MSTLVAIAKAMHRTPILWPLSVLISLPVYTSQIITWWLMPHEARRERDGSSSSIATADPLLSLPLSCFEAGPRALRGACEPEAGSPPSAASFSGSLSSLSALLLLSSTCRIAGSTSGLRYSSQGSPRPGSQALLLPALTCAMSQAKILPSLSELKRVCETSHQHSESCAVFRGILLTSLSLLPASKKDSVRSLQETATQAHLSMYSAVRGIWAKSVSSSWSARSGVQIFRVLHFCSTTASLS
mmetsp:Transcript_77435/g.239026  ORF Transcript_77435/g.239026 Transcript_77435/m.239026 type:complete len:243 (-) Transcript_77435:1097-1825(-)